MIIVSHRGPYTFSEHADGTFEARRGAGGVVSALGPLLHGGIENHAATWIAAAIGPGDRAAVRTGSAHVPGVDLVLLDLPEDDHRLHYDVVSNEVLWFLHHGIFDLTRSPSFGPNFTAAWAAYRGVNERFADAVCEHAAEGDTVFVQDYQLALVPALVAAKRPDLRPLHFSHIPFCGPNSIRALPDGIATEYLDALAQVRTGFHSSRWARAFQASAREVLGHREIAPSFTVPLGPDPNALAAVLADPAASGARAWLDDVVGDRLLVARSDRIEPTKNIVRGFEAFELLLTERPEWLHRVVFVASCYRSRSSIEEYRRYADGVEATAARINDTFGTADWQPIVLDVRDDHVRSMVVLARADVTLVNSLKDGLNLVAMEGPVVNTQSGVVVCSREAGAYDLMADGVLGVNPFDLVETAQALDTALRLDPEPRSTLAATARSLALDHSPQTWLDGCLAQQPT